LLFVAEVDLEEGVDRGLATACQPHEGASAVVGIWAAFDQAGVGKTVKPLGHPPEGEQHRLHQLGGLQRIGLSGAAEGASRSNQPGWSP
jgi:hypothetical protein